MCEKRLHWNLQQPVVDVYRITARVNKKVGEEYERVEAGCIWFELYSERLSVPVTNWAFHKYIVSCLGQLVGARATLQMTGSLVRTGHLTWPLMSRVPRGSQISPLQPASSSSSSFLLKEHTEGH